MKATLQQEVIGNKNERYQNEIKSLSSDLAAAIKDKEDAISERDRIEKEMREKIEKLEAELLRHREQDVIVDKMSHLEEATKKLDKMTQELNEALGSKNREMTELLRQQSETETKLDTVQNQVRVTS